MANIDQAITANTVVKTNSLIYYSILLALVFVTVIFFINHENQEIIFDLQNQNFLISIGLGLSAIVLSSFVFNYFKNQIDDKLPLQGKIAKLQTSYIIRYAIIEMPVFLIIFLLQDNKSYFIIPAILILFLLLIKPSRSKIEEDLNLTSEQRIQFNQGDEVL